MKYKWMLFSGKSFYFRLYQAPIQDFAWGGGKGERSEPYPGAPARVEGAENPLGGSA